MFPVSWQYHVCVVALNKAVNQLLFRLFILGGPPQISGQGPAGVWRVPGVPAGVQRASQRDTGRKDHDR